MSLEGSWIVESMEVGGVLSPLVEGSEVSIDIADGRLSGGGINRYMGSFDSENLFGPIASTMMAGPVELMDQEHTFLKLLEQVDSVSIDRVSLKVGGRTVIVLAGGGTEEE